MQADKYIITFYVRHCEYHFGYGDRSSYAEATAFLNERLQSWPIFRDGRPVLDAAYYYVEEHQQAAFEEFLQWSARRATK
jgi:hypothetical protein